MNTHQQIVKRLISSLITTTLWCSLSLGMPVYAYTQEEASQLVKQAYCTILTRDADEGGFNNFVNLLTNEGWTAKQLVSALATSEEYKQKFFDNQTTPEYVTQTYHILLQREPDPDGLINWINMVEQHGWLFIIEGMLNSEEYMQRFGNNAIPVSENCSTTPSLIGPPLSPHEIPTLTQNGANWVLQIPYIAYEFLFGKLCYTGELFSEDNGQTFLIDYPKVFEVEERAESADTPKLTMDGTNWLFNLPKVHNMSINTFESMQLCSSNGIEVYSCDCTVETACPALNQIPFSDAKPSIGIGYGQDRNAVKTIQCFNGKVEPIDGGESEFSIDAFTSYSDVIRASEKSISGSLGIGDFKIGGEVKESEFYRKTNYDQLVTLSYNVILETDKFVPDINNFFIEAVRPYLDDPCLFKQYCGDSFVEQVELGANLYIKMHFVFDQEIYHKEFSASAGLEINHTLSLTKCDPCTGATSALTIPISASISAAISKLSQSVKQHGTMKIYAVQTGGNVEYLASAVGSSVSSCSLTNIKACTDLIDKVINYAATDFADSVRTAPPKVLTYITNSVATIPGAPFIPSELTPEIKQAREELARYYKDAVEYFDKVSYLLLFNLEPARAQKMQALEIALKNDITDLEEAIKVCRTDLRQCWCKQNEVVSNLQYLDMIDNPEELELGYQLNDGLLLHLAFESNTQDSSWNQNHGQVSKGNLTYLEDGVSGSAAYFDGGTEVNIVNTEPFKFTNSSFTLSAWVDVIENSNYRGYIALVEHRYKAITLAKYRAKTYGNLLVQVRDGGEKTNTTVGGLDSGAALQQKGWLHVVGVVDQSQGSMILYVNGIKQGHNTNLINFSLLNPRVLIGNCITSHPCINKGPMDEVRIWHRALSEREIQTLYNMDKP